jgi:hypothetical protein
MHAAIHDVAEVKTAGGIPHRTFDQAISGRNALHGILPYSANEG